MNSYQEVWLRQAQSDFELFEALSGQTNSGQAFPRRAFAPCHALHYLQMATEKISKAHLWRSGKPPTRSHRGIQHFMRSFGNVSQGNRKRIARLFGFSRFRDLKTWLHAEGTRNLVYELEKLAPALAIDGPNPEYPWPHDRPVHAPVDYEFEVWAALFETNTGRVFQKFFKMAILNFEEFTEA